jgi:hypothetical protein
MRSRIMTRALCAVLAGLAFQAPAATAQQGTDTAFAALQERGRTAMGVDQYASKHRFDDLPDGGRIELRQTAPDSAGTAAIRAHLTGIARAFAAGDFTIPGVVHAGAVPGTRVMVQKQDLIDYRFRPLPGGGEIRLTTRDPEAQRAIHRFLSFQRGEHRAGGTEIHTH